MTRSTLWEVTSHCHLQLLLVPQCRRPSHIIDYILIIRIKWEHKRHPLLQNLRDVHLNHVSGMLVKWNLCFPGKPLILPIATFCPFTWGLMRNTSSPHRYDFVDGVEVFLDAVAAVLGLASRFCPFSYSQSINVIVEKIKGR